MFLRGHPIVNCELSRFVVRIRHLLAWTDVRFVDGSLRPEPVTRFTHCQRSLSNWCRCAAAVSSKRELTPVFR